MVCGVDPLANHEYPRAPSRSERAEATQRGETGKGTGQSLQAGEGQTASVNHSKERSGSGSSDVKWPLIDAAVVSPLSEEETFDLCWVGEDSSPCDAAEELCGVDPLASQDSSLNPLASSCSERAEATQREETVNGADVKWPLCDAAVPPPLSSFDLCRVGVGGNSTPGDVAGMLCGVDPLANHKYPRAPSRSERAEATQRGGNGKETGQSLQEGEGKTASVNHSKERAGSGSTGGWSPPLCPADPALTQPLGRTSGETSLLTSLHARENPFARDLNPKLFLRESRPRSCSKRAVRETNFLCYVCLESFPSQALLIAHHPVHPNKNPYRCAFCFKLFQHRATRDTHLRIHTGDRPYQCDFCLKSFSQKGNRDAHLRIHTGEKPFPCDFCPKSFAQRGNCDAHIRNAHAGQRDSRCNVCSKSFSRKALLDRHKRSHVDEKVLKL